MAPSIPQTSEHVQPSMAPINTNFYTKKLNLSSLFLVSSSCVVTSRMLLWPAEHCALTATPSQSSAATSMAVNWTRCCRTSLELLVSLRGMRTRRPLRSNYCSLSACASERCLWSEQEARLGCSEGWTMRSNRGNWSNSFVIPVHPVGSPAVARASSNLRRRGARSESRISAAWGSCSAACCVARQPPRPCLLALHPAAVDDCSSCRFGRGPSHLAETAAGELRIRSNYA